MFFYYKLTYNKYDYNKIFHNTDHNTFSYKWHFHNVFTYFYKEKYFLKFPNMEISGLLN